MQDDYRGCGSLLRLSFVFCDSFVVHNVIDALIAKEGDGVRFEKAFVKLHVAPLLTTSSTSKYSASTYFEVLLSHGLAVRNSGLLILRAC
jgi:hypothetical protein